MPVYNNMGFLAIDEVMPVLEETYKARCLVASEGG